VLKPGDACLWSEATLGRPSEATLRCDEAGDGAVVWAVPAPALRALAAAQPQLALEVGARLSQRMAHDLGAASAALKVEPWEPALGLGQAGHWRESGASVWDTVKDAHPARTTREQDMARLLFAYHLSMPHLPHPTALNRSWVPPRSQHP
jgi:CRP-like cAMP-binding protein